MVYRVATREIVWLEEYGAENGPGEADDKKPITTAYPAGSYLDFLDESLTPYILRSTRAPRPDELGEDYIALVPPGLPPIVEEPGTGGGGGIDNPPNDGNLYARRGGNWEPLPAIPEPLSIVPEDTANKGEPGGYAALTGDGTLPLSQLPAIEIGDRITAATEAEMLAATRADGSPLLVGDIAIRTDNPAEPQVFMLTQADSSIIDSWTSLTVASSGVASINDKTGVVVLTINDIPGLTAFGRELVAYADLGALKAAIGTASSEVPGLMSAADKQALTALANASPDVGPVVASVPLGSVVRFVPTLPALPEGYVELTDAIQEVDSANWPTLKDIFPVRVVEFPAEASFDTQTSYFLPDNVTATAKQYFGLGMAMNFDANRIAISAHSDLGEGDGTFIRGAVYVYNRNPDDTWTREAKILDPIIAATSVSHQFGYLNSVSMNGDGTLLAVGAMSGINPTGTTNGGRVELYSRDETGVWSRRGQIIGTTPSLGSSTDMTLNGDRIAIGSRSGGDMMIFDISNPDAPVELFRYESSTSFLGETIAISDDGLTVAVGSPREGFGKVHIFRETAGVWSEVQILDSSGSLVADEDFGNDVAFMVSGERLIVGAPRADSFFGAVYVFDRQPDGSYLETQKIASPSATADQFGYSVSVSSDASVVAIGAMLTRRPDTATQVGALYVAIQGGTGFYDQELIRLYQEPDTANHRAGENVVVSGDATGILLSGAYEGPGSASFFKGGASIPPPPIEYVDLPAAPDLDWLYALKA